MGAVVDYRKIMNRVRCNPEKDKNDSREGASGKVLREALLL